MIIFYLTAGRLLTAEYKSLFGIKPCTELVEALRLSRAETLSIKQPGFDSLIPGCTSGKSADLLFLRKWESTAHGAFSRDRYIQQKINI